VRHDLTGVQRKAYAAEVGRLVQKLAENSNSQNLNDEWFKEIVTTIGVTPDRVPRLLGIIMMPRFSMRCRPARGRGG